MRFLLAIALSCASLLGAGSVVQAAKFAAKVKVIKSFNGPTNSSRVDAVESHAKSYGLTLVGTKPLKSRIQLFFKGDPQQGKQFTKDRKAMLRSMHEAK
jgi:hypothetical protein